MILYKYADKFRNAIPPNMLSCFFSNQRTTLCAKCLPFMWLLYTYRGVWLYLWNLQYDVKYETTVNCLFSYRNCIGLFRPKVVKQSNFWLFAIRLSKYEYEYLFIMSFAGACHEIQTAYRLIKWYRSMTFTCRYFEFPSKTIINYQIWMFIIFKEIFNVESYEFLVNAIYTWNISMCLKFIETNVQLH